METMMREHSMREGVWRIVPAESPLPEGWQPCGWERPGWIFIAEDGIAFTNGTESTFDDALESSIQHANDLGSIW